MSPTTVTLKKLAKDTVKWGIKFPIVATATVANVAVVNTFKTVQKIVKSPFDTFNNTKNQS